MNITGLVKWLYALSDVPTFKAEIRKMTSFYEGDIIEKIDPARAKFKVAERNQKTEKYENRIVSIEKEIINRTESVINRPAENIVPHLEKSKNLTEHLVLAEHIANQNVFHKNFPKYFEAIERTKKAIEQASLVLSVKKGNRGNPNFEGLSSSHKAKIINLAEQLLKDNPNYQAISGAYVSEPLKHAVNDALKTDIPDLSIHKVGRILRKHYKTKKNT